MKSRKKQKPSPLIEAVRVGNLPLVLSLLDEGMNPDDKDSLDGISALMEAVLAKRLDLVDLLIQRGADVSAQDNAGYTALHFAARDNEVAIAERLLAAGAPVDAADEHGISPLGRATYDRRGFREMIELLIRHGAEPGRPNKHGISPRDLAKTAPNPEVRALFGLE